MPVADTSFLVDLMRRDKGAIRLFEQFEDSAISLNTTGITALELYKGAYSSADRENLHKVKNILSLFTILPIDEQVYEVYGMCAAEMQAKGKPLGVFDEVIAAIALCIDQEIITRDRHFEKIPGLKVTGY